MSSHHQNPLAAAGQAGPPLPVEAVREQGSEKLPDGDLDGAKGQPSMSLEPSKSFLSTRQPSIGAEAPSASAAADGKTPPVPIRTKDWGFLPIPNWRRYNPEAPFQYSAPLNFLFAGSAIFTVANLYYCQPLLVQYSESFGISYAQTTHIPALLQGGYAAGLLLISPMGDMVRRRQLCLGLLIGTTLLSIGLAATNNFQVFEGLSFIVGFLTVTPQIMIPLAADLAPPRKRAQAMSTVLAGLLLGILVARVLGGIVGQYTSWRNIYWLSVGAQSVVFLILYWALPDYPPKNRELRYRNVHVSMAKDLFTNPVLVHGCILGAIGSSLFSGFWTTLTFLLSARPYEYSTLVIGLFGLVGIAGVCTAPFVGKLVDRLVPWTGVLLGNVTLLAANVLLLGGSQVSIAFIVIGILLLDIGQQLQQVSNQTRIYATNPTSGARLNSMYIISLFIGQLIGSSALSKMYLGHGARAYYGLGVGLISLNLLVLFARGPVKDKMKWIGWGDKDAWALKKEKLGAAAAADASKKGHSGDNVEETRQDLEMGSKESSAPTPAAAERQAEGKEGQ